MEIVPTSLANEVKSIGTKGQERLLGKSSYSISKIDSLTVVYESVLIKLAKQSP